MERMNFDCIVMQKGGDVYGIDIWLLAIMSDLRHGMKREDSYIDYEDYSPKLEFLDRPPQFR